MFDVVIAGGGANGLTLALALCRFTQLKLAVVEANAYQQQSVHPGFDARVIALAKGSQHILHQCGLSLSELAEPIKRIHVSDSGHLGQCVLEHQDYQLEALGYVIELQRLGHLLRQAIQEYGEDRLQWFCPDQISAIRQQQSCHQLTLQSGEEIESRLLVVAEGSASPTRELLNIGASAQPYNQVAVIANLAMDRPHQGIAYERFTEHGPLALLPMRTDQAGQTRYSLVWSIAPEQQVSFLQATEAEFLSMLQRAFGYRAGRFIQVGARHCYPLSLCTANQFVSHRTVLIGNAAQTLHPIAGQGLNLGLRDVADLGEMLQQAEQQQADPGSYAVLSQYRQTRDKDKTDTIGLTDGLVKLFSNQHLPTLVGRNLGLFAMQMMAEVKTVFAMQTTGLNQIYKQGSR